MPQPDRITRFLQQLFERLTKTIVVDAHVVWDGDFREEDEVYELRIYESLTEIVGGGRIDGAAAYHGFRLCLTDVLNALSVPTCPAHVHVQCIMAEWPHRPCLVVDGIWKNRACQVFIFMVPPAEAPTGAKAYQATGKIEQLDDPVWPEPTELPDEE